MSLCIAGHPSARHSPRQAAVVVSTFYRNHPTSIQAKRSPHGRGETLQDPVSGVARHGSDALNVG